MRTKNALGSSSRRLKCSFLIIICPLSVVVVVVIVVDVKFSYFLLLLQNYMYWINFYKIYTMHSWVKGIQVCSNEGSRPFSRGDYNERVKIY